MSGLWSRSLEDEGQETADRAEFVGLPLEPHSLIVLCHPARPVASATRWSRALARRPRRPRRPNPRSDATSPSVPAELSCSGACTQRARADTAQTRRARRRRVWKDVPVRTVSCRRYTVLTAGRLNVFTRSVPRADVRARGNSINASEGSLRRSSACAFRLGLPASLNSCSEPTVFENYVQDIQVDDDYVEMSLWDTAGSRHVARTRVYPYLNSPPRSGRVRPSAVPQLCRNARHYVMLQRTHPSHQRCRAC